MAILNDTLVRGALRVIADANIGGNVQAATFNGLPLSGSVGANTIPIRDSNGYVYFNYINTNIGVDNSATSSSYFLYANSDGWIRKANAATIKTALSIPTAYLASASVSGNTLTINPNSGNAITFTPNNQTVKGNGTAFGANDAVNILGTSPISVTANTTNKTITIAVADASTSAKGVIKIGTTASDAAAGNHNHDGVYLKLSGGGTVNGNVTLGSEDTLTTGYLSVGNASLQTSDVGFQITQGSNITYIPPAATGALATQSWVSGSYLPLSGGTMIGNLNLKANQYNREGALNCNNSDIMGVNSIYTQDTADNTAEGIRFYRSSGKWDSFTMSGGVMYFMPNDPDAGTAFSGSYVVLHSGNISSYAQTSAPSNATITIKQTGRSDQTFTLNGSATTINLDNTTYSAATQSAAGLMSATDKTKLDGIASGAEVNVQSDWNVTDSSSDAYIKNKPTIPTSFNLTDDILDGSANKYAPYAVGDKAAGRLYVGTTNPTNTTRLNYDGYFYATKLYSGGNEVLTGHQSIKTLKTDNTTAQTASASEAIAGSGTINLHKVAKTGTYSDLIGKPTIPATNVIPTSAVAGHVLLSTEVAGTAMWSAWTTPGVLMTNNQGIVSPCDQIQLNSLGTLYISSLNIGVPGTVGTSFIDREIPSGQLPKNATFYLPYDGGTLATQAWVGGQGYTTDSVSGVNDGTNWTSITINGVTKNIPSGGSGSLTLDDVSDGTTRKLNQVTVLTGKAKLGVLVAGVKPHQIGDGYLELSDSSVAHGTTTYFRDKIIYGNNTLTLPTSAGTLALTSNIKHLYKHWVIFNVYSDISFKFEFYSTSTTSSSTLTAANLLQMLQGKIVGAVNNNSGSSVMLSVHQAIQANTYQGFIYYVGGSYVEFYPFAVNVTYVTIEDSGYEEV